VPANNYSLTPQIQHYVHHDHNNSSIPHSAQYISNKIRIVKTPEILKPDILKEIDTKVIEKYNNYKMNIHNINNVNNIHNVYNIHNYNKKEDMILKKIISGNRIISAVTKKKLENINLRLNTNSNNDLYEKEIFNGVGMPGKEGIGNGVSPNKLMKLNPIRSKKLHN